MLAGEVAIYAAGLTWLALDLRLGAAQPLSEGLTSFLAGDPIKATIAVGLLAVAWRLAGGRPYTGQPGRGQTPDPSPAEPGPGQA
jgi:biotin transport system substrate-specific component